MEFMKVIIKIIYIIYRQNMIEKSLYYHRKEIWVVR
jgi:hypothetical protein